MGAGVNLFKQLFPNDYYPYTANTLISSKPTSKVITGKNLLPPCNISGSGAITITTNNGEYTISGTASGYSQFIATDTFKLPAGNYALKNFENTDTHLEFQIRSTDGLTTYAASATGTSAFTLDKPTELKARIVIVSASIINQTIKPQIEFGSTATAYEPYSETTIVYSGNELRGLLKVGTNGLYADGDTDDGSGTGEVRYGIVDLGSLNWNTSWYTSEPPLGRIYAQLSDKKIGRDNMICDAYPLALSSDSYMGDLTITGNTGNKFIYIRDTSFNTITRSKTIPDYTADKTLLKYYVEDLLDENYQNIPLRLVGVGFSHLVDLNKITEEVTLFNYQSIYEKEEALRNLMSDFDQRFGKNSLFFGKELKED